MQTDTITRLTTLADTIHGKRIRLGTELLRVGQLALVGKDGNFRLAMEVFIDDGTGANNKCPDCGGDHSAHPAQLNSTALAKLALDGTSGDFLLDSSSRGESGRYTVKLQGTKSRRCFVGEGNTLLNAIAAAVAKSAQPA